MIKEDEDLLRTYERTTWRTAVSQRVEQFSAVIADQEIFERFFGEKYVQDLSVKIDRQLRMIFILSIAYTGLMISLYLSQDTRKTEFEIFGYGFKNLGYYKEFLLLLAAGIAPASGALSAYRRYLAALRLECLKRLAPEPRVREYFSYIHVDNYFDPLVKPATGGKSKQHGLTLFIFTMFLVVLFTLLLALMIGSFILQLNVIYDVAVNPASPKFVNVFIVIFALLSIGLSWLIGFMQLPLPEIDMSFYRKLEEIKSVDEERHKELLRRMARISARRERLKSGFISALVFVVSYLMVAIFWRPEALQVLGTFVLQGMAGALLTTVLASGITEWAKTRLYRRFFKDPRSHSEDRLPAFVRLGKLVGVIRVVAPIALSLSFAVLVFRV